MPGVWGPLIDQFFQVPQGSGVGDQNMALCAQSFEHEGFGVFEPDRNQTDLCPELASTPLPLQSLPLL